MPHTQTTGCFCCMYASMSSVQKWSIKACGQDWIHGLLQEVMCASKSCRGHVSCPLQRDRACKLVSSSHWLLLLLPKRPCQSLTDLRGKWIAGVGNDPLGAACCLSKVQKPASHHQLSLDAKGTHATGRRTGGQAGLPVQTACRTALLTAALLLF